MTKLRHVFLFLLLFLSFCHVNYSQTQQEKKPLEQILLQLEKHFKIKFSYETDLIQDIAVRQPDLELPLSQVLRQLQKITPLNYKILSKRFVAITPKTADTAESIQYLEEVIVTNFLTKGLSKTNNGTIEANTEDFIVLPGLLEPDVLQIIQNSPGVISVDERISNINVRGGTNDQNLVLYEGIRMYQTGHFFGLISAFNPNLSETISISKNGTSARFGNGVSSTISIAQDSRLKDSTNFGIGSNLLSADGYAKIPLSKKIELQIAARRSFTDVLASATYDAYFDRIFRDSELNAASNSNARLALDERFFFYDLNAKLKYNINATSKFRINILNFKNNLDYDQIFTTADNNFQETESELSQTSFGISSAFSKAFKNGINTSVQFYYSHYDLDATNNDLTNDQSLTQENTVEDYGLRIDFSKTLSDALKFNGGYQFNEVGVTNFENATNPNFTSFVKEIIRTNALFGEIEWYSNSRKTYIRLGSRISSFGKLSEVLIEPRFNINYKFLDHFRLEVLGELKSQSITQIIDLQQDFFGIEKRRWQLANGDDVPLITSEQVSLGLNYNHNNLFISIEGYYKSVNDITARSQGFQNQFQFTEDIGSYTVQGIEFLINKRFNKLSTWLSYTYSRNDYQFQNLNDGRRFANTLDLRHVANASLIYNLENFELGLGINWHTGRPYTKPSTIQDNSNSTIEYDHPNGERLPSYFRTDLSAIYHFKFSQGIKAELGASVWNIFNQTNIINRNFILDSDDAIIQINNRALKFTPNLSLRLRF